MPFDKSTHGLTFAPEYPPRGNSDHLPMALCAFEALGAPAARLTRFASAYLPRLVTLPAARRARVGQLLAEVEANGIATTLDRHLPHLISGWYREAYHPLIRLAYGKAFDAPTEVAAGLAYLEAAGPDPRVAALASKAQTMTGMTGLELLEAAARHAVDTGSARSFGEHAAQHLAQPWIAEMAVVLEDNLREMSRTALDALASTHDFFALHLVTGSHAFRVLESHAGPDAAAVMNLGLLAGYLVIGAPTVRHFPTPKEATAPPDLLALCRDDEHDAKLAHTADAQARHWNDPAYVAVAARYLTRNARGTG